jgi:hypothetical protein
VSGPTSAGRLVAVRLGAAATSVVALGSAVLSWDALSWGAAQLGVDARLTWLYPVVIDGTITVGTIAALALRGADRRIRAYVWTLLAGAIGASVVVLLRMLRSRVCSGGSIRSSERPVIGL